MNPAREQPADDVIPPAVRFADRVRHQEKPLKRPPLRQGHDPAAELYREQAKRDAEAAHKWLAQQSKRA